MNSYAMIERRFEVGQAGERSVPIVERGVLFASAAAASHASPRRRELEK